MILERIRRWWRPATVHVGDGGYSISGTLRVPRGGGIVGGRGPVMLAQFGGIADDSDAAAANVRAFHRAMAYALGNPWQRWRMRRTGHGPRKP